jgi:hypothetical protein
MDRILKVPELNQTVCVGGVCGAEAINQTGLTAEQDSIKSVHAA